MEFFKHPIFIACALLEIAGIVLFGFGDWANVIQNVSIFGMAYGLWLWTTEHRKDIEHIKQQIKHLHAKHDELHEKVDRHDR